MATDVQQYRNEINTIKQAILHSQYRAAKLVTGEQLSLYFGIGCYVSANSRQGAWGTGAIERISEQLRKELPGLRGFSAESIKKMRSFYEFWQPYINRSPLATDLRQPNSKSDIDIDSFTLQQWSPIANEINREEFLSISFSHHMEILNKAKKLDEVLFYIHQTVLHKWDKYDLRDKLNPTIGILLCKSADKAFVEYVIRDYNNPMGVATYKTVTDMDEKIRRSLPDMEDMRKLLIDNDLNL